MSTSDPSSQTTAWRWRDTQTLLIGMAAGQLAQLAIMMWRTWP